MSEVLVTKMKENKLVRLELNLPEKRNILSFKMIQTLTKKIKILSKDSDIHVLILSGRGGHFCAGGDLRWMSLSEDVSDLENINQVQLLSKMFYTLLDFPYPIIGDIQGSVFGGGLGLTAICDIAVAHKDSKFCFSELKLALVPAVIAPFVLKKMPATVVRELILSARVFSAIEAKSSNLINFLGDKKECGSYISHISDQLLKHDKVALKQTKKLLNTLPDLSPAELKSYTIQALAERRKSPEVVKRIKRFLKSRQKNK